MALIMLDTGLRVNELVQLTFGDLFNQLGVHEQLVVRAEIAKNKNNRVIPLTDRLKIALTNYCHLSIDKFETDKKNYIFSAQIKGTHITTRQVQRIINTNTQAALNEKFSPHALRHTFGTRLMRTTNMRIVQELMGHKNIKSTAIYTHPNSADLTKAINTLN